MHKYKIQFLLYSMPSIPSHNPPKCGSPQRGIKCHVIPWLSIKCWKHTVRSTEVFDLFVSSYLLYHRINTTIFLNRKLGILLCIQCLTGQKQGAINAYYVVKPYKKWFCIKTRNTSSISRVWAFVRNWMSEVLQKSRGYVRLLRVETWDLHICTTFITIPRPLKGNYCKRTADSS